MKQLQHFSHASVCGLEKSHMWNTSLS